MKTRTIHPGFTLIEVTVTVLLLAVLSTIAVTSLRGAGQVRRMKEAVEQLALLDRLTRREATQLDRPMQIVFDVSGGHVNRVDQQTQQTTGKSLDLASGSYQSKNGIVLEQVMVGNERTGTTSGGGGTSGGQITVPCSAGGLTPTYAVALQGPKGTKQWIVFAGLTGAVYEAQDDQEVSDIFKALQAALPGGNNTR